MREKLIRFMQGRYGIDTFSKFLLVTGLVVTMLSSIFGSRDFNPVGSLIGWIIIIYCYFRIFSKNITKRYGENQVFLKKTHKFRCLVHNQKNMWNQRKTHHIYKCPSCGQKIRIPKGKGKIEVRCPKCSTVFERKS